MPRQKLNQFTRSPEYIAYLAYILSSLPQEEDRIRTIAGFLLKNNARFILSAPPEVAEFVKAAILQAFTDSSIMIRNAASQDIVTFLGTLEPRNWPECLQHLVNALDSPDLDRQEVSVGCFAPSCAAGRVTSLPFSMPGAYSDVVACSTRASYPIFFVSLPHGYLPLS